MAEPWERSELTPDWLTGVLRASGGLAQARVASVALEPIGTFTNELVRVRLDYDRAEDGAPGSLVLKRAAPGRGRRGEEFVKEIRFYRELAGASPVRTPCFHFGSWDDATGRGLLLTPAPTIAPGAAAGSCSAR